MGEGRTIHDCRDAGGRATQETKPRSNCRELRQEHDPREGGVSVKHDCMDAGGRATHGAVAEEARTE